MNNNTQNNGSHYREAPSSWNTKYLTPEGFVCQFTLRSTSGSELLEKASAALTHLLESGCQPHGYGTNSHSKTEAESNSNGSNPVGVHQEGGPNWCPIHETPMKKWEKEGQVWYSHKTNGEWCQGKQP